MRRTTGGATVRPCSTTTVVVAVEEPTLRVGWRGQGVQPEPLERRDGVPDLDDGRARPMRRDVNGQIRVVHDEQAGRAQVVHPAHQADQVGQLAAQAVAVRLQEQGHRAVGIPGDDGVMDGREVAVQDRDPRGRQDDPFRSQREEPEDRPHDPQQRTREQVFDAAHAGLRPAGGR